MIEVALTIILLIWKRRNFPQIVTKAGTNDHQVLIKVHPQL